MDKLFKYIDSLINPESEGAMEIIGRNMMKVMSMDLSSKKKKAVVIVSGGMDSITLLYKMIHDGYECHALSFDYGQRHKRELSCARLVCSELKVPHLVVNITSINKLLQGSALTTPTTAVPEGHYEASNMKLTVVPNRNMIMLSLAIGYAVSLKIGTVAYGAHAGDHEIYPDCRPEFIDKLNEAAKIANYTPVRIFAPFSKLDKAGILKIGNKLGVDYSVTRTCYTSAPVACGRCGSCGERLVAFHKIGKEDPLAYKDRESYKKFLKE